MGVQFLHTADLHLGSPLRAIAGTNPELRERLHEATYTALERIVETALTEDVDFVLFAGDLYDQESRSVKANQALLMQFERLDDAGIPSYVIYGNHDPLGESGELFELPDSVHVFGHEDVGTAEYPPSGPPEARILGQSYRVPAEDRTMYRYFSPPDDDLPNIGMLHTALNPDSNRYVPCSLADLRGKDDIHYWALGHIHEHDTYAGSPYAAYPGIPQPRHIGEAGVGGCLLVDLEADRPAEVEFVPVGPIVWERREVPVDGSNGTDPPGNLDDLEDQMLSQGQGLLEDPAQPAFDDLDIPVRRGDWEPEGLIVRWELTGRGPIHPVLEDAEEVEDGLAERLRRELGSGEPFLWTEAVRQKTAQPLPDIEEVRDEDPVIDRFLDIVEDVRSDPEAREELQDHLEDIWFRPRDPEDEEIDAFPLTDERLDDLIDRARDRTVDRLLEERESHVDE